MADTYTNADDSGAVQLPTPARFCAIDETALTYSAGPATWSCAHTITHEYKVLQRADGSKISYEFFPVDDGSGARLDTVLNDTVNYSETVVASQVQPVIINDAVNISEVIVTDLV